MWRKVIALLLFAGVAKASPLPCSPVFIAGPQGRPIPGAQVTVVNTDSTPIVTGVWANGSGTVPFNGQMPVSQILQVFIEAGIYQATVTGSGVTKTYQITCGEGIGEGFKLVSIDRTAELLLVSTPQNPPQLTCPLDGTPCFLSYVLGVDSSSSFDFIAPTYPLTFDSFLLSWKTGPGEAGTTVWMVDWCTYKVGEVACFPNGTNAVVFPSTENVAYTRTDLLIPSSSWNLHWNPSDHVVVRITRHGTDARDTVTFALLENVRLELTR